MNRIGTTIGMAVAAASIATGGDAATRSPAPEAKALDPVLACRAITDGPARLACYDSSVGALQAATAKHDVVVIDQRDVERARRSLFGFSLPAFDFLGGGKAADNRNVVPEDSQITATIRAARLDGDGNWSFTLDDGAVWHQTSGVMAISPRPGETVEIRRGTLGSYFMRVGRQPGFRAKRES